ncbi:ABC transporter ATP-binding protein, partial [Patescibacteria group bacterium]|nr:ABC transporter ATP-binding protein [Patescibacteria group bacterium]
MPIIEVKNISKKYNITHQQGGYVALRDVLTNVFKNPFQFAKNKAKQAIGKAGKEEFWALKDINFSVEQGEIIGIIGPNGAGKSTLLKILTQITPPTTGEIKMRGRVASLLEVGTGFHPELTGRENIFLNGAIMGMTKKEINAKFNDIVEFSGIEKFLDTPVKRYSSGMHVRLAFSVAAHLEPDILLIDEVLAVGDADFQKKCLGKMEEVTKKDGRTILFVSHNMGAIEQLCGRCILLKDGEIKIAGKTGKVINEYLNKNNSQKAIINFKPLKNKEAQIVKILILNKDKKPSTAQIPINEKFFIQIDYKVFKQMNNVLLSILFFIGEDLLLLSSESDKTGRLTNYLQGKFKTIIEIPAFLFNVGQFYFNIAIHRPYIEYIDHKQNIYFEILDINNPKS